MSPSVLYLINPIRHKTLSFTLTLIAFLLAGNAWGQFLPADKNPAGGSKDPLAQTDSAFYYTVKNNHNVPELLNMGGRFYQEKNWPKFTTVMERISELRPHQPEYQWLAAKGHALQDHKSAAYDQLIRLQKLGLAYDPSTDDDFAAVRGTPVYDYIVENLQANGKPFGGSQTAFTIDDAWTGLLYESLAYDPKDHSFLLGSVRDGSVIRVKDGQRQEFIPASNGDTNGPWSITDLAVDAPRNRLWVASTSLPQYSHFSPANQGMAGIFEYELDSGKLVKNYVLPPKARPHLITSLTVAPDGAVYFNNNIRGHILRIDPTLKKIGGVLDSPIFRSINGLATDETGKFLYFSDFEFGLFGIDLEKKQLLDLANPAKFIAGGIDDIIYDDNGLIVIQNGIKPQRVMRIQLSQDKRRPLKVYPIESANPAFDLPSHGVVVGDKLYYSANSQWRKMDGRGLLKDGEKWDDQIILVTDKHYKEQARDLRETEIENYKKKLGLKK